MRILFITHFFPPRFNAGTENYTHGLALAFLEKGHEVQVICAEDWHTGEKYWNEVTEEVYEGVMVKRIHLNWTRASNPNRILYDSLSAEKWLTEILSTTRLDLVHVTSTHSLGVGILRSVKRSNIPLILTLMDFWFLCPSHQLFRSNGDLCDGKTTAWECQTCLLAGSKLFQRFRQASPRFSDQAKLWGALAHIPAINKQRGLQGMLLDMEERKSILHEAIELPDVILSHSEFVKSMFSRHHSRQVEVLQNGHDFSWLVNYEGKTRSDVIRFGYLGQIQITKGVHLLIEAFQKAQFGENARLEIWGDISRNEAYVQQLRNLISDNSSISLNGSYDHKQLAKVLADIDVVVVPSLWYENAPLIIQEAFAARTPVIATNLGGMAEFVTHEVNGLLFQLGDVEELSKQLQYIVDEPSLLKRLQIGIPTVKSFSQEVSELEAIYYRFVTKIN